MRSKICFIKDTFFHRGPASFLGNWEGERLTVGIDAFRQNIKQTICSILLLKRNISAIHTHSYIPCIRPFARILFPDFQMTAACLVQGNVLTSPATHEILRKDGCPYLLRLDPNWWRNARRWSLTAGYMKRRKTVREKVEVSCRDKKKRSRRRWKN